ncbi:hypothetical protein PVK06_004003 [Gossypium arboreum]|uniref:RNase H type-1 domain-containing protein n=1 Tax=Gossypium arboreum TaxID=29729 RepID=A0ABR0QS20_GOSAR|nr:hypothetical protein PVK06_004003 [Gossypium arboreum]
MIEGKGRSCYNDLGRAHTLSNDFRVFNLNEPPVISLTPVCKELKALIIGMKLASILKLTKIIMESDNATLINTFKNRDKDVTILGCCVKQKCKALKKFDTIQFNWIDRKSNDVVDMLSKIAIKNRCDLTFEMDYPLEIHDVLYVMHVMH